MKRPGNLFVGILLFLSGKEIYLNEWDSFYGLSMPKSVGIFLCVIGVIFSVSSFIKLKPLKEDETKEYVVCVNCKEKYKTEYVQIPVCPKCDGKLVEYKE